MMNNQQQGFNNNNNMNNNQQGMMMTNNSFPMNPTMMMNNNPMNNPTTMNSFYQPGNINNNNPVMNNPQQGFNQGFNNNNQQQGFNNNQQGFNNNQGMIMGNNPMMMMGPPPTTSSSTPTSFYQPGLLNNNNLNNNNRGTTTSTPPPPPELTYDPTQVSSTTTRLHYPTTTTLSSGSGLMNNNITPNTTTTSPSSSSFLTPNPMMMMHQTTSTTPNSSSSISTPPSTMMMMNTTTTPNTTLNTTQQQQQQGSGNQQQVSPTKIDPRQMPSPARFSFPEVNVKIEYQTPSFLEGITTISNNNNATVFPNTNTPLIQQALNQQTSSIQIPPPSDRRCRILCKGSCSTNRIRSTLHCLPQNKKLLDQSNLVMGAMLQPMHSFDKDDVPNQEIYINYLDTVKNYSQMALNNQIPTLNNNSNNNNNNVVDEIIRCGRCRAYMNPFVRFSKNGKEFYCNFCGFSNETPDWYYSPVDHNGIRSDIHQRLELQFGDVNYLVGKKYFNSKMENYDGCQPMTFCFVIDVGNDSIENGILLTVLNSIKYNLLKYKSKYNNCRVAIITYSKIVHFYNLKNLLGTNVNNQNTIKHPQVLMVGDLQNCFVPIPVESLITINELTKDENQLNEFFDRFYDIIKHVDNSTNENCCGSALKCAEELLTGVGGRILLFTTRVPTLGHGTFIQPSSNTTTAGLTQQQHGIMHGGMQNDRNPYKLVGSDREKELFICDHTFWKNIGVSLAKKGIGVDSFLFSKNNIFMEVANLTHPTSLTNGHAYLYHNYNNQKDSERVLNDLNRLFERENGYDAVLKVRCSSGLSVRRYFGHFYQQNEEDLDLAVIDSDSCFAVELKHDESNLNSESGNHYIQVALVYTNSEDGKRYLRVQTCKLKTSTDPSTLFKKADVSATLGLLTRLFVHQIVQNRDTFDTVRDMMTDRLVRILACYRKNCSNNSSSGQLILPETLKLLPLYILGLAKSPAFCRSARVALDKKIYSFFLLMKMSAKQLMYFCYPRLIALHQLTFTDEVDEDNQSNAIPITTDFDGSRYPFPPILTLSASQVNSNGIYLLFDGNDLLFWVGNHASKELVTDLFGVSDIQDIHLQSCRPTISILSNDKMDDTIPNAPFVNKVRFILKELLPQGIVYGHIYVYRESAEGNDTSFFIRLTEDKFGSGMSSNPVDKSYTDYLCILHREVLKQI
ncbi:hypothetical protein ABK040_008540 [Willaertia magna]